MATGTIPRPHSDLPMFHKITVIIGDTTTNSNGNCNITSKKPATPSGYTQLTTIINGYSNANSDPHSALLVNAAGTYIYGPAGMTIKTLSVDYIFVRTEDYTSS